MRATFYYPWYPEQWDAAGHRYSPIMGEYSSSDSATILNHINQMKFAKVDVGLYSWWGQRSLTDNRFKQALDIAAQKGFSWAIYYELDNEGQRPWTSLFGGSLKSDLKYLSKYFSHPAYRKIANKPVIFVYCPNTSVAKAEKWKKAQKDFNLYVSLTEYPEWWTSKDNIDSWHPYRPADRVCTVQDGGRVYGIAVSAGFWAAWEDSPRLDRNFESWNLAVSYMREMKPDWELVYFNEHGEGTVIEPCLDTRCEEYLCSDYLQSLGL